MIAHREFLGASIRYGVRVGSSEVVVDMPFLSGRERFEPGGEAMLSLPPHSLHWL